MLVLHVNGIIVSKTSISTFEMAILVESEGSAFKNTGRIMIDSNISC